MWQKSKALTKIDISTMYTHFWDRSGTLPRFPNLPRELCIMLCKYGELYTLNYTHWTISDCLKRDFVGCVCAPCCVMSTGKLHIMHIDTHSNVALTSFHPSNYQTLVLLRLCRVEECCFLWGFNSLFTAVLLVQNPFLETNMNQSNLMSAQQGLSNPTV